VSAQGTVHRGALASYQPLESEAIIERMAERLAKRPDMLVIRRSTVEHPFGTIKQSMN
jgi:hypothetical protein